MRAAHELAILFGCWVVLWVLRAGEADAQPAANAEIRAMIEAFKKDPRGPYQGIRWFCPDGTVRPASEPCPEPGGLQHGLVKDAVQDLARRHGVYLGQILAGTPFEEFLDRENDGSRLKQYQMERFLQAVDEGWIFRKAQYYRGAFQAGDEEAWGMKFLVWMLGQDGMLESRFFLCRQACVDIPHGTGDNRLRSIRALATNIAGSVAEFRDLRIKIHGQPDTSDLGAVRAFREQWQGMLSPAVSEMFEELEAAMASVYRASDAERLEWFARALPAGSPVLPLLQAFLEAGTDGDAGAVCRDLAELLWAVRDALPRAQPDRGRVVLMDLSLILEEMLFRKSGDWHPATAGELLEKADVLALGAAGCGFLEVWEWGAVSAFLMPDETQRALPLEAFIWKTQSIRRVVNWGAAMVRATYGPVATLFAGFEPLANGFVDDRIRASVLLRLGETAGNLADVSARFSGVSGQVMGAQSEGRMLGLNPGFAVGQLEVITGPPEEVVFLPDRVYAMLRAPEDLKPVAGIATVTEGNAVSHVQLLARNLGIPNAVISPEALRALAPFSGRPVFYAVSPRGTVVLKPAEEMTAQEQALVAVQKRREERVRVPTDRLDFSDAGLPRLRDLRASDSGRLCGPKAANLGQLHALFPGKVAPGLVIPFGVFRRHMDQPMPGTEGAFWAFVQETFEEAAWARADGVAEAAVEGAILERLGRLREAIKQMSLSAGFAGLLERQFAEVFGSPMGEVPVFVRSDTNMEDLKDFTGAGLNLTVPNVRSREAILQAIRDVWASPFTERSYRWRQKFLLNPEDVYPSLLLMQSVNVEKSGVMITAGLVSEDPRDVTVAFNRGVGGAVEGQSAESYLLRHDGSEVLLFPAREPRFTYLPPEGGVKKGMATFEAPLLSPVDRSALFRQAGEVRRRLAGTPGVASEGPFDVELGFLDGRIYLFQVRPFVESKQARSSAYLRGLDPELPAGATVVLDEPLGGR